MLNPKVAELPFNRFRLVTVRTSPKALSLPTIATEGAAILEGGTITTMGSKQNDGIAHRRCSSARSLALISVRGAGPGRHRESRLSGVLPPAWHWREGSDESAFSRSVPDGIRTVGVRGCQADRFDAHGSRPQRDRQRRKARRRKVAHCGTRDRHGPSALHRRLVRLESVRSPRRRWLNRRYGICNDVCEWVNRKKVHRARFIAAQAGRADDRSIR